MAGTVPGTLVGRFDAVRWARALGCADVEDLTVVLERARGLADTIADDVSVVQRVLAGLGEVEPDAHELLARLGVLAEGAWMVVHQASRAAFDAATGASEATSAPTGTGSLTGGAR